MLPFSSIEVPFLLQGLSNVWRFTSQDLYKFSFLSPCIMMCRYLYVKIYIPFIILPAALKIRFLHLQG